MVNKEFDECPNELVRQSFANGSLTTSFAEEIALHVANCRRCSEALNASLGNLGKSLSAKQIEAVIASKDVELVTAIGKRFKRNDPDKSKMSLAESPLQIGRFRVKKFLGEGSYGAVYEAIDPHLKTVVAVKLSHRAVRTGRQFLEEAQMVARLDHKNVVRVLNADQLEDLRCFIVFEMVKGKNLRDFVSTEQPSDSELVKLFCDVVDGTAHAHERGIIHRDLKPTNILIGDNGIAKIADFGLSVDEASSTNIEPFAGTRRYMAPEQHDGASDLICPATDVYALGKILAELKPSLRCSQKRMKSIDAVIRKCCQSVPSRRYVDAAELRQNFEQVISSEQAKLFGSFPRMSVFANRRSRIQLAILAALLATMAIFLVPIVLSRISEQHVSVVVGLDKRAVADYTIPWLFGWGADDELSEIAKDRDKDPALRLKAISVLTKVGQFYPDALAELVADRSVEVDWLLMAAISSHAETSLPKILRDRIEETRDVSELESRFTICLAAIGATSELKSIAASSNGRTRFLLKARDWLQPSAIDFVLGHTPEVDDDIALVLLAAISPNQFDVDLVAIRHLKSTVKKYLKKHPIAAAISISQWLVPPTELPSELINTGGEVYLTKAGQLLLRIDEADGIFMSSTEISVQQFRNSGVGAKLDHPFVCDRRKTQFDFPNFPAYGVTLEAACAYCNELSRLEKRKPCYEETGVRNIVVRGENYEIKEYRRTDSREGYRLPTVQEIESAAKISGEKTFLGDVPLEFDSVRRLVNIRSNEVLPCANGFPTHKGFFHLIGNIFELCHVSTDDSSAVFFGGSRESRGFQDVFNVIEARDELIGMPQGGFRIVCEKPIR